MIMAFHLGAFAAEVAFFPPLEDEHVRQPAFHPSVGNNGLLWRRLSCRVTPGPGSFADGPLVGRGEMEHLPAAGSSDHGGAAWGVFPPLR